MVKSKKRKYIFVVGGVLSGVGKGVTSASLGAIFKAKGFKVTALKIDPYINIDAGTMNPIEHGEVFVTDDGDETDQDMGNYERFLNEDLNSENYMTTGRIYLTVIENERSMKYKGRCVEVVPHIPEEVIRRIKDASEKHDADITLIEVGGTLGEYQNLLFLEAGRMMKLKDPTGVAFVMVSYLPIPSHLGEMKTKPTQQASHALNSAGINADFIVARGKCELDKPRREKLAVFCNVFPDHCISAPDVSSIYEIPIRLDKENLGNKILKVFGLPSRKTNLKPWLDLNKRIVDAKKEVKIAVVGKYFGTGNYTLADSYISVIEAIKHAAWFNNVAPKLEWIDSEEFSAQGGPASGGEHKIKRDVSILSNFDGLIVPGGWGSRGIEGVIMAIKYARENKLPYLAQKAYGTDKISERHRHRYEFNNEYRAVLEKAGLKVSGINPESNLVEIVELENHPFFVGVQFHPEFKSRPMTPHPLFREFVRVACKQNKQ